MAATLNPLMVLLASFDWASFVTAIPTWAWFDVGFTLMVVGGVAGEADWAARFFVRDRLLDIMPVESRRKTFKRHAANILILGLMGELVCLGFALHESAEMHEEAERLRLARVELEKQVEVLRKQNDEFEAQQLPRMINQTKASNCLREFSGTKTIIIAANDGGDSVRTAEQIFLMLESSKWNVGSVIFTLTPVPDGISIGICSTNELWRGEEYERRSHGIMPVAGINSGLENFAKLEEICAAFADELNRQVIATKRDEDINRKTSLRFNGILIFVSRKPTILESKIVFEESRIRQLNEALNSPTNLDLKIRAQMFDEYGRSIRALSDLQIRQASGTAFKTNMAGGSFISFEPKLP